MRAWIRYVCSGLILAACCAAAIGHPEFEAQLAELNAAIAARPGEARLYLARGRLFHDHAEYARALTDYDEARAIDPGLTPLSRLRGETLLALGCADEALALADTILADSPGDSEGLLLRAASLAALGRSKEAAAELLAVLARLEHPSIDLRVRVARAFAETDGGLGDALASLDAGVDQLGPIVTLRLEAVRLARRAEEYDLALERLDALIAESPVPVRHQALRGVVLAEAGRRAEAVEQFVLVRDEIDAMSGRRRLRSDFASLRAAAHSAAAQLAAGEPLTIDFTNTDRQFTHTGDEP